MSLKYRDSAGTETPVAGLNGTSGELVPSTSLVLTGTISLPEQAAHSQSDMTIKLPQRMPDSDYEVFFEQTFGNQGYRILTVHGKSIDTFALTSFNADVGVAVATSVSYKVVKLMTDEDRALDEQAIADLQAVVPSTATSSNQLVPANGKVRGLNTGNWISDDFNKAVPSDNSSMQIFTVLNSAANTPDLGANYIVLTQVFSSGLIQQEAIQNGTNYRYIRNCDSGTWSAWSRIATEKECVLYKTVSSISDIRALAKNRSYFLTTTASFNVVDDGGTSYTIPAGAVSTPFHWSGGDTHIEFYYNYPVGSSHIWAVFLNSNGQNRGKQLF